MKTALPDSLQNAWLKMARSFTVPPLTRTATIELAGRLCRGCGLNGDTPFMEALFKASAGLPELLVRLIAWLHADEETSAAMVQPAFDALLASQGDPTRLMGRANAVLHLSHWPEGAMLLDLIAASPRPRLELIAAGVSKHQSRLTILSALQGLESDGWLVDVDGEIRFEHPVVAEAWRARPPESPQSYEINPGDIPF